MNISIKCLKHYETIVDGKSVINGSSYKSTIRLTYPQLVEFFGQPTYEDIDDKVCFEWVLKINDKYVTIYDWKYNDPEWVKMYCKSWHVGGHSDSFSSIIALQNFVKQKLFYYDV